MKRLRFITVLIVLCAAVTVLGCGGNEPQPSKIIDGNAVTLSAAWDYALLSDESSADFWVETRTKADYRSDEAGRRAGAVYFETEDGGVYVFADKAETSSETATIYLVGKSGDQTAVYAYGTEIAFEGANHATDLKVVFAGDTYYVKINGKWLKINEKTVANKNGEFDFFTYKEKKYGVGNVETGTSEHENVAGGKDAAEQLKECLITLTVDCAEGGSATLSVSEALAGEKVTVTVTPDDESYLPIVTFNGRALSAVGENTYEHIATVSGKIEVKFARAFNVSGTYGYAAGFYADGDTVTVRSETTGLETVGNEGEFAFRLTPGVHKIIAESARFGTAETTVTVEDADVALTATLTFDKLAFTDGTTVSGGTTTLSDGDYKQFAGVKEKNFFVEATVKRMDNGETVGGVFYNAGSDSPVEILAFEDQTTHNFKIRLTRGKGWDDRSDRDYATDIPFVSQYKLTAVYYDNTLYVGIDDKWTAITAETSHTVVVNNTDFDPASVWNAGDKTFGLLANGVSTEGYPIGGIRYGKATEATVDDCYYTLSVVCADEKVTAELNENKVLKGGKAVLTLAGLTAAAIPEVEYNGETLKPVTAGVYEFTAIASGEITVIVTYAYIASGNYTYASGLYAEGDTVVVKEKQTGVLGTAGNGAFSIALEPGTHTLVLSSARFADVETTVEIAGENVAIADALTFTTMKFDGGETVNGTHEFTDNNQAVYFGGISLADFAVTADYTWLDGETSSGLALKIGGVQYRIFAFDNGGKVKICVRKGTDFWDDRNDLDYATELDWNPTGVKPWTYTMKVVFNQGVMYVGINGKFVKITTDTAYTLPLSGSGKGNIAGTEFLNTAEKQIGFVSFGYEYGGAKVTVSNIVFSADAAASAAEIEAALAE